jgi:two-component system CheB/CheR fusion protein
MVSAICGALRTSNARVEAEGIRLAREIEERRRLDAALHAMRIRSAERFQSLVTATAAIVWTTDAAGAFVERQPSWESFTGQPWEEYAGAGWVNALHPEDRDRVRALWQRAITTGSVYESEGRLWHASSRSYRYFQARAVPVLEADGSVREWIGTCTDTHERGLAHEVLKASEAQFRQLADALPQIVWTARPDGFIDYYNERWYEYTGLPRGQFGESSWEPILHPDDVGRCKATYSACIRSGQVFRIEYRFRDRETEGYRWFLGRAFPVRDEAGRIVRWFGTCTDIDDTKRAQEALKEADRRKDEFLATLAHELRNPLAPLRNGLQIMRVASQNPATVEQAREMMERQLAQMVRLIDDLLDVSRITRGTLVLRKERVELAAIVRNGLESAIPLIEANQHELRVDLPDAPILVDADVTRLAQVFLNLLNNAAKYTDPGGKISLAVERQGSNAVVSVRDTGVGIPPYMLPKVFEMFTQVSGSPERSQGGLGIGLTIVKRLVEMHGGAIEARSDGRGKGSEFIVRLPIVLAPAFETSVAPGADGGGRGPARRRVLIADDNADAASSLAVILHIMGNEVLTAHDGVQAVEAAAAFRPDVILLDIGMPKMNGLDACRKIREQSANAGTVLIAMTGWGQDEDKDRSREAGFDLHLVKPVEPADLEKVLNALPARPE